MKYRFIVHWIYTPRDISGNVYSCFRITDTRSGRQLMGRNAPESSVRGAVYHINGNQHKQNYYFVASSMSKRQFSYYIEKIPYIGCDPEVIAQAFKKLMRSRKRGLTR